MPTWLIIFLTVFVIFTVLHALFTLALMAAVGRLKIQQDEAVSNVKQSVMNLALAADQSFGQTNGAVKNIANFLIEAFGLKQTLQNEKNLEQRLMDALPPSGSLKN
jgi:hypothetical protein